MNLNNESKETILNLLESRTINELSLYSTLLLAEYDLLDEYVDYILNIDDYANQYLNQSIEKSYQTAEHIILSGLPFIIGSIIGNIGDLDRVYNKEAAKFTLFLNVRMLTGLITNLQTEYNITNHTNLLSYVRDRM